MRKRVKHSHPFSGLIAHQRNGENQSRATKIFTRSHFRLPDQRDRVKIFSERSGEPLTDSRSGVQSGKPEKGEAAPHVPLKIPLRPREILRRGS